MGGKRLCPRCGSPKLLDIVYGTPANEKLRKLWADGKVMLRPRRPSDGKGPGWACGECGLEWAEAREIYGSAPRPK